MNNFWQDILYIKNINNPTIGIMGGSFNPPHNGHLHISNFAIKKLNLDMLLWLITPLSPFKKQNNMLSLKKRYFLCQNLTKNNYKIRISTLEKDLNSNYTFNTMKLLSNSLPQNTKLIWLMGEDILYYFDKFYKWQDLTKLINIAIIARGGNNSFLSLRQKFPQIMKKYYINSSEQQIKTPSPTWSFYLLPRVHMSSTSIRKKEN